MSDSVRAVGEDEPQGVINGTSGAEHDEAEHDLHKGGDEDESDDYDEEEADYEEEKQAVGDEDDQDDDDDYEEGDEDDDEGGDNASKPSMTHLLLGNPNAPVDGDDFADEDDDDEDEEDYEPEAPAPTKKRSREEFGEEDVQDPKKVKA